MENNATSANPRTRTDGYSTPGSSHEAQYFTRWGTAETAINPTGRWTTFRRDDDLWMEDGNIILVAGGVGFCVYRGVLTRQSEVFRAMLGLPQPPQASVSESEDTFGGIPVVPLSDSSQDVKYLLQAILPSAPLFNRYSIPSTKLAAVIRLSNKYGFIELERHGLECLESYYTSDFYAWNAANRDDSSLRFDHDQLSPIEVIDIARLTGTPSLLPVAFYRCVTEPDLMKEAIRGHIREDGTLIQLNSEDIIRCFEGQRRLVELALEAFCHITSKDFIDDCPDMNQTRCERTLDQLRANMESDMQCGEVFLALSSVYSWYHTPRLEIARGRLCKYCLQMAERRDAQERERIWHQLYDVFNLRLSA
ncbi:hypothetical protein C2E23DRAFT_722316 [Lenzites betulinus]|nr:hypothetical protein C2E23DRAFT_722316 [Lenzites betulinus]